ncbi:hypothetical protein FGF92_24360, partial [Salmonella sp. gx-f5]|nr:hypothetical protein [Salmonella sp. gx-f5]
TSLPNFTPIKLTRDNYLLWKAQVVPYLKGQHLFSFVDGSSVCPSPMITTPTNQTIPNPAFMQWIMQDQLILSALNSSLSETV